MYKLILAPAWLACLGHGRRLQQTTESLQSSPQANIQWVLDTDSLHMIPVLDAGDTEAEDADLALLQQRAIDVGIRAKSSRVDMHFEKNKKAIDEYTKFHEENGLQIRGIQKNLDDVMGAINELAQKALDLNKDELPLSEMARIREALVLVEEAQASALHYTEHLIQDRLALDTLSGPSDENKEACQDVALALEALAQKVGMTRSLLNHLHDRLDSKSKLGHIERSKEDVTAKVDELARVASALGDKLPSERKRLQEAMAAVEQTHKDGAILAESIVQDMVALVELSSLSDEEDAVRYAAILDMDALIDKIDNLKNELIDLYPKLEQAAFAPLARATIERFLESPPPEKAFWSQLELPIDFGLGHDRGEYSMFALIPGLSEEDLQVVPSDDREFLIVTGFCIPNGTQSELMRKEIAVHLQELARTDPRCLSDGVNESALYDELYTEMGKGDYGQFSRKRRLPKDADVGSLSFIYADEMLLIIIPKEKRVWRPRLR